jgi:hypothetical protein
MPSTTQLLTRAHALAILVVGGLLCCALLCRRIQNTSIRGDGLARRADGGPGGGRAVAVGHSLYDGGWRPSDNMPTYESRQYTNMLRSILMCLFEPDVHEQRAADRPLV